MQMLRAGATLKLRPYAARLRRSAALGAAAALALLPLAQSASAETLSDALAEAVRNSARIEAQRQVVFGQDENVEQARSGLRPSITGQASAGAVHTDNSESPKSSQRRPTSLSLTGTQTLYDGGQTQNAVDSASATVRGAEQTLVQTEQTVLLDAVDAYVSVLAAEENVALASNNVRVIGEALEAAQDRFEVGEVTRTDVAQAEARLAEARATLTQQQGVLNQERVSYQRQIGSAPGRLAALPALPPLPASLDDAVAIARRDHPSITAARFNVDSASATVRQARGALLPQISAQGVLEGVSEGTNDTSGQFSASAEVTITVPFYQGGALRSEVFQSQALADQRRAELSQTTREIIESVGIAWQNLITARAQIDSNRSQIRAARIALEGVQEEAKVGARTTLDVLDAEQELLDAQTTLVDSRSQEYIAAYSLLSAIGRLTVAHLDLDVELRPRGRPSYVGGQPLSRALPQTEDTQWRRNWRP